MRDRRRYRLEELKEEIREIDQALADPVSAEPIGVTNKGEGIPIYQSNR